MHPAAAQAQFESEVAAFTPALAARRQWIFHSLTFPLLDCAFTASGRTPLRVRFTCDQWNEQPPAITLHAADGGWLLAVPPNPTGIFNAGPHPVTGRPFICMRGAREYHMHPSHLNDPWEAVRNHSSFTLGGILTQIWNAWQKGAG